MGENVRRITNIFDFFKKKKKKKFDLYSINLEIYMILFNSNLRNMLTFEIFQIMCKSI
jgi:hypothetical protein